MKDGNDYDQSTKEDRSDDPDLYSVAAFATSSNLAGTTFNCRDISRKNRRRCKQCDIEPPLPLWRIRVMVPGNPEPVYHTCLKLKFEVDGDSYCSYVVLDDSTANAYGCAKCRKTW